MNGERSQERRCWWSLFGSLRFCLGRKLWLPGNLSGLLHMPPQGCRKFVNEARVEAGYIGLLKWVIAKIEQLVSLERVVLEEFPGASPNGVIVLPLILFSSFSPDPNEITVQ